MKVSIIRPLFFAFSDMKTFLMPLLVRQIVGIKGEKSSGEKVT